MIKAITLSTLASLVISLGAASAQAASSEELYQASLRANDQRYREHLRTQIAEQDKSSALGVFARAWVLDQEGKDEQAIELYKKVLAMDPSITVAANNVAYATDDSDKATSLRYYRQAMEHALKDLPPHLAEHSVRYYYYDLASDAEKLSYAEGLRDGDQAQRMAH
ncbi:MAG: hypothetical protein ACPG4U_06370, partial [Pseudomonadales bacterium]